MYSIWTVSFTEQAAGKEKPNQNQLKTRKMAAQTKSSDVCSFDIRQRKHQINLVEQQFHFNAPTRVATVIQLYIQLPYSIINQFFTYTPILQLNSL